MVQLGEELRRLREECGLRIEDEARLSRLDSSRIREIESGAAVSTAELAVLADALGVDPGLLHSGRIDDVRRTVARFRAPEGISAVVPNDARLLARAAEMGRIGGHLWKLLGRPRSPVVENRSLRAPIAYPEPWSQGYELGKAARDRFYPKMEPLDSVQELFEQLGIHVAYVHFDSDGVEAASLFERDALPVILLNRSATRVQYGLSRRAILAHELCHLLHDGGERDLTIVSRDESLDASPIEKRANGFAPNFLAPADWVSRRQTDPVQIVLELAGTWGLSFEGAAWHARNLKLISIERAEALLRMGSKPPVQGRDFEMDLPRTPPDYFGLEAQPTGLTEGLLSELTIMAAGDRVISKGRAEEILSLR
jgi:Zn-dependent peptidase ImmA (M78 family)/transcriptional regulator with XRE-family HTH domain